MAKLTTGEVMPDLTYNTPFRTGVRLSETAGQVEGKTAVIFLRYYGCTLCQYDIHCYAKAYEGIRGTGGQILVVLQSDPVKMAEQLSPEDLPFEIICDPEKKFYEELEIVPAASMAKMAGVKTAVKVAKATAAGFKHGEYEGEELQLPATFVMDKGLKLSHVHYGKTADDVPTPEELIELLG